MGIVAAALAAALLAPAPFAAGPAPDPTTVMVAENWTEPGVAPITTVDRPDPGAPILAWGAAAAGTAMSVDTGQPNTTVLANVTAVATRSGGYTSVWPCGSPRPTASTNNYITGTAATPNFVAVKTDSAGYACLYTSGDADLLFDQYGTAPGIPATTPTRRFDTRKDNPGGAKLPAGGVYTMTATPGATVWGNLTVTAPEGYGHTRTYPCSAGLPATSTNNYIPGQTTPNFTAVKADEAGHVCFYTSSPAHLIFDQVAETGVGGTTAGDMRRIVDTRTLGPAPAAGATTTIHAGPANAIVSGNLTAVGVGSGHTRIWDCSGPPPSASTNNFTAGRVSPVFATVHTNTSGDFCVYTSAAAHLLWDQSAATLNASITTPVRKLDTRTWGGGAAGGDDSHWAPVGEYAGQPYRWNSCQPSINVYLNPANSGSARLPELQSAVAKLRSSTGLPLTYAGTTTTTPTTTNGYGADGNYNGNRIVVAFARSGTDSDLVPAGYAGVGGSSFESTGGPAWALFGFTVIDDAWARKADTATVTAVLMHEVGHVVGLGHYNDTKQVMNPVIYNTTGLWGRGDWHGLSSIGRSAGCPS